MAYPTLVKTYDFDVNNLVYETVYADNFKNAVVQIKNALLATTTPWVVRRSSNASVANTSDNWTSAASITSSSGAHSWIVLGQPALGTNYEFLIDMDDVSGQHRMDTYISQVGFTSGTTTARPTATDEIQMSVNVYMGAFNLTPQAFAWHLIASTDGTITHVVFTRANMVVGEWHFEAVAKYPANWTHPVVSTTVHGGGANSSLRSAWAAGTYLYYAHGRSNQTLRISAHAASANSTSLVDTTLANAFDQSVPFTPILLGTRSAMQDYHHGNQGLLIDSWWTALSILNIGDTFPENGDRDFIALGQRVYPWDGSSRLLMY